jgi:hypothetical protein
MASDVRCMFLSGIRACGDREANRKVQYWQVKIFLLRKLLIILSSQAAAAARGLHALAGVVGG